MTAIQNKDTSPVAHLSAQDIEQIGTELDAIRQAVLEIGRASCRERVYSSV